MKKKENGKRKKTKKRRERWRKFRRRPRRCRARVPVGRDAWDEGEQGDGTAMDSDVGTGFSGDRAGKV